MNEVKTVVIALVALLAMGCTSKVDKPDVKEDIKDTGIQACSDVWVVGNTLPTDYEACDNNGVEEWAVWVECKDGSKFTTFNDEYHARAGMEISNTGYDKAYWKCIG